MKYALLPSHSWKLNVLKKKDLLDLLPMAQKAHNLISEIVPLAVAIVLNLEILKWRCREAPVKVQSCRSSNTLLMRKLYLC